MNFWKSVLDLLKQIVLAFLEVNLSILKDLESFRNKLVFFTCGLVTYVVIQNNDFRVCLAALGLLEIFLCYYFNNRKMKDNSVAGSVVEKISKLKK